jgi:hypothetical protein
LSDIAFDRFTSHEEILEVTHPAWNANTTNCHPTLASNKLYHFAVSLGVALNRKMAMLGTATRSRNSLLQKVGDEMNDSMNLKLASRFVKALTRLESFFH